MTHSEEIKFLGYTIPVQVPLYLIHPGVLEDISGILPFTTPNGASDNVWCAEDKNISFLNEPISLVLSFLFSLSVAWQYAFASPSYKELMSWRLDFVNRPCINMLGTEELTHACKEQLDCLRIHFRCQREKRNEGMCDGRERREMRHEYIKGISQISVTRSC